MSGIIFKVYEVKPSGGRMVHRCVFMSAFADHAIVKAADFALSHPGVSYQLCKANVFTLVEVVLDSYKVERCEK